MAAFQLSARRADNRPNECHAVQCDNKPFSNARCYTSTTNKDVALSRILFCGRGVLAAIRANKAALIRMNKEPIVQRLAAFLLVHETRHFA